MKNNVEISVLILLQYETILSNCISCGSVVGLSSGKIIWIVVFIVIIGIVFFAKGNTNFPSTSLEIPIENADSTLTLIAENSENIVTHTVNSFDKNYITISYDPIPDYANGNYVRNSISDAIQQWTDENPEMTIQLVESNGDVQIEWKKVIFGPHSGYMQGKMMEVELGSLDCNNNWNQYSIFSISDTISHELGHYLGLEHSADPTHLMYGEDEFTQIPFDNLGYDIPDNHLDFQTWIEYDILENEYDDLNYDYVQLNREYSQYPETISSESQYQKAMQLYNQLNQLTTEMNMLVDEMNCIADVTP